MMNLKFIGTNGSMGLIHGKVYNVNVFTKLNYILVTWKPDVICPYDSPQSFAANWAKP